MSSTFFTDVKNALEGDVSIVPQNYSTAGTKTGAAVDMQLSDGPVHALVMTGDGGDADTNWYVKLQESDASAGTYTDIDGSTSSTYTGATAGDSLFFATSTNKRTLRYVRAVVVIATTGTADVDIAVAVLGRKKILGSGAGNYTTVT